MLKLNRNYSDYTDETDSNYPEGKAVNASSSESYDGTPLLAEFMNDVNAAHIAMYEKAYGNRTGISGVADTQKVSQFAEAVAKYTNDKVKAHADQRGLANGVHGATSAATAGQIITRDEYGRAKVAAPVADGDIANKKWVDDGLSAKVNTSSIQTTVNTSANAVSSNAVNTALKSYVTKAMILDMTYPVGSLYWSSKATNPSTLFGGTWVQIKDKFILAAGDTYKAGATGGSATVKLTESNLPAHSHTCSENGSHSHTTNSQSTSTTGNESQGHTHPYSFDLSHKHAQNINGKDDDSWGESSKGQGVQIAAKGTGSYASYNADGYEAGGNSMYWGRGWRVYTDTTSLSISKSTGGISAHHTHSYAHTHGTDSKGSHSHTIGSTGLGTSFSILPPCIVKYCFERTA